MAGDGPNLDGWRMRLVELTVLVGLAIGADRLFPDAEGWSYWAIGLTLAGLVYLVFPRTARWLYRCRASADIRRAPSDTRR